MDSGVGIYAPDPEAYRVFGPLFDPIIEEYHVGFKHSDSHPPAYFGSPTDFGTLDPEVSCARTFTRFSAPSLVYLFIWSAVFQGKLVISTRIRCGRSIQGYPFNPCLTLEQYKEMEEKATAVLSGLAGDLAGKFYPLTGMPKEVQQRLIDDHFLFKEGDRFLEVSVKSF